ncbi:MAG: hypothetical protein AB1641_29655 [Thermodesulfobacteriota bacterium]
MSESKKRQDSLAGKNNKDAAAEEDKQKIAELLVQTGHASPKQSAETAEEASLEKKSLQKPKNPIATDSFTIGPPQTILYEDLVDRFSEELIDRTIRKIVREARQEPEADRGDPEGLDRSLQAQGQTQDRRKKGDPGRPTADNSAGGLVKSDRKTIIPTPKKTTVH